ncbi:complex I NDUFA9 subunit family protein [Ruegeria marina]|uniref:NADH dehydrogenase n=1 Tax=Ruegeria marina TaxID=639004 RepID=A0A1G6UWA0_9RHOB|nr:complex I NDUFA9 subunit family protein [Ruegeria marina]SDD45602.1 NADH dehydrogenase [Ruegeria marina]
MSKDLYTVFGGTGFLGQRIAGHLLENGHRVRVVARRPERGGDLLQHARAEAVSADILRPESLSAALQGAAGAINAVSLYRETRDLTFERVHCEAASQLAAAAMRSGVGRFIQISGIGADPRAADDYIRARGRGESVVRDAFPSAVIVRPSVMFGEGDAFLTAIAQTIRRLPIYPLFGQGLTRLQPVYVDDVAMACAKLLAAAHAERLYEFGGPRVLTYRQLVGEVAQAQGRTVHMVPVPFAVWRAIAAAADILPAAPITRSQIALIEEDNVASRTVPGLSALGIDARDIVAVAARLGGQR